MTDTRQREDSPLGFKPPATERDVRFMLLIILCCCLLLPLAGPFLNQGPGSGEAERDLFWDSSHGSLAATKPAAIPPDSKEPARVSPLLFKKIPVNRADIDLLDTIPGIGPERAGRIIHEREKNGNFQSVDDLLRIPGIGPKRKEQLRAYLRFD